VVVGHVAKETTETGSGLVFGSCGPLGTLMWFVVDGHARVD